MVERRVRGHHGKQLFTAHTQADDYNDFMGGVDDFDFRRAVCSAQRKSRKWWHSLFYFIVDAAKANAYVEAKWKFAQLHPDKKYMRPKEFYSSVAQSLMDIDLSSDPKPKRLCTARNVKISGHRGIPDRENVCLLLDPRKSETRGNCKHRWLTLKKKKDVWSKCGTCGVHCHWDCMRPWHAACEKF